MFLKVILKALLIKFNGVFFLLQNYIQMKNLILIFISAVACVFISCNNQKTSKPVLNSENSSSPKSSPTKTDEVKEVKVTSETNTSPSSQEVSTSKVQFSGKSKGCESFTLFKMNEDKTMAIWINGNSDYLKLSTTSQKFPIGKEQKIFARIYQFNGSGENYFCNDIANQNLKVLNRWEAIQGNIKTHITQDNISVSEGDKTYKMTLLIESAIFKDKKGEKIELENVVFEEVLVGWYPG